MSSDPFDNIDYLGARLLHVSGIFSLDLGKKKSSRPRALQRQASIEFFIGESLFCLYVIMMTIAVSYLIHGKCFTTHWFRCEILSKMPAYTVTISSLRQTLQHTQRACPMPYHMAIVIYKIMILIVSMIYEFLLNRGAWYITWKVSRNRHQKKTEVTYTCKLFRPARPAQTCSKNLTDVSR